MKEFYDYSLLAHNTFGMDVHAEHFFEYACEEELKDKIARIRRECPDKEILSVGAGSNLLFLHDFPGIILHSAILGVEVVLQEKDHVVIRVGSGMNWDQLVAYCVAQGWYGAENLSWIPGEVGASAVQNIGAYGTEVADLIWEVEAVDVTTGEKHVFKKEACEYAYRSSIFKKALKGRYAITYVSYRLSLSFVPHLDYGGIRNTLEAMHLPAETVTAQQVRDAVIHIRKEKLPDPEVTGNAGSFFINPVVERSFFEALQKQYPQMPFYEINAHQVKIPAGWLIDQCGWKGRSLGPAGVHQKQALVLVNLGGATGADVVRLADAIRKDVWDRFGIQITPEVNFIG